MKANRPLHLFEGFGIELEYMIVDRANLAVRPLTDRILQSIAGEVTSEVECGALCWSNELVLHVIELKTNGPAVTLSGLAEHFQDGVNAINRMLETLGARLLPSAMHPWMDPHSETVLWPHENSPVYAAYNRIFGCQGHGWANLQSSHLNLPFGDDDEFGRLHAAIRLVLPLLPALAASSPLMDGRITGLLDTRLHVYRQNQKRIPMITGRVIPEPVFSRADYEARIFAEIYRAIALHDPEGVLQHEWLNSRGAIARFERDAIEIRVLDVQESPQADLAIAAAVVAVLRALVEERWGSYALQQKAQTEALAGLLEATIRKGEEALVEDGALLALLGRHGGPLPAGLLWRELVHELADEISPEHHRALEVILERGTLARRILRALGGGAAQDRVQAVYRDLGDCLAHGELFGT